MQGGARLNTGTRSRSRQASVAGSNENLIDDKVNYVYMILLNLESHR